MPYPYRNVRLSPNPLNAGQSLKLTMPQNAKGVFYLTDMLGRPVYQQHVDPTSEIKFQPRAGMYIWRITLENGLVKDGKLVVE